jgi:hypothetical protein
MAFFSRMFLAACMSLCVATSALAGAITVSWAPNAEGNLAGYRVSYGRSPGTYDGVADVGLATAWTMSNPTAGTTYYFRVYAYNYFGAQSEASIEVSTTTDEASGTSLFAVSRTQLTFGAQRTGGSITGVTPAQTVVVTQRGPTSIRWTAVPSAAWLHVTPASGAGTGAFTVKVVPTSTLTVGIHDATVTISGADGAYTLPVRLRVHSSGASAAPFGAVDTPVDGTVDIAGAIPVTGWAMDDVHVSKVQIFRDPVLTESGLIYIGDATFVPGARPDVEKAYRDWPSSDRGGWGFMLLSNMLPDVTLGTSTGGNGTFKLHAYAIDAEGQITGIGSKKVSVNNRASDKPFGTLDTPTQGGTAAGSAFVNFGWAMSPGGTIPEDGSTLSVLIDGVVVGRPTFNNFRADIAAAFPGYANSNGAIGYYVLDTTKLTNGIHTIAWVATDSVGNTSGLGSRFFTVLNTTAAAVTQAGRRTAGAAAAVRSQAAALGAEAIADLPADNMMVEVARAAATEDTLELVVPEETGEIRVGSREAEPLELRLTSASTQDDGGKYEGYMIVNGDMRALPAGSSLDVKTGTFSWQPGAGFIGTYHLLFLRTTAGGETSRIPVRIRIAPKFDADSERVVSEG